MGAGVVLVLFLIYGPFAALFSVLVGSRSSGRAGWLTATALVLLPLALLIGFMAP
ncbi:hypothetical protein ABZ896_04415 [Streptomyces sp. NPDC047072]|uniref:hypothetical protein n=1 Tax=Streptomyces sp. NPDC047072 TaxID=3154809 RepID=UPI0033E3E9B0